MPKHSSHILELAKRGAELRLRELVQEAKNVIDLIPHLRDSYDKDELPLSFIIRRDAGPMTKASAARRIRRRTAAAARKAVSLRMESRERIGWLFGAIFDPGSSVRCEEGPLREYSSSHDRVSATHGGGGAGGGWESARS